MKLKEACSKYLNQTNPTTLFALFFFNVVAARAQNSWTNRYNGPGNSFDEPAAIAVDGSGNVFVTGSSAGGASGQDYATVKYSDAGMPLWTNRYNGPGNANDVANAIAISGTGNVFVTGYSLAPSSFFFHEDFLTIAYSGAGVPLWTNRYNGFTNNIDVAQAIAVDASGNVFVTGFSISTASDYVTIKYSNAGTPLWTNRYNGSGNSDDYAGAIAVDGSGNVFVTGDSVGSGTGQDYVTIKYSAAGVALWTNRYNGSGNGSDLAKSIAVDGGGNVFVTGTTTNSVSRNDYLTIKYSNDGLPLWTNRYNGLGNGNDVANTMALDGAGDVFVTGTSTNSGTRNDYATIKYSNAGVPIWTNRYNGSGNGDDQAYAIAVDGNGKVFVTGTSTNGIRRNDYATIAYSQSGMPLRTNLYNGPGNSDDYAGSIAVDGKGNAFVTGDSGFGVDYATIKYEAALFQQNAIFENLQLGANQFSFVLTADPGAQFAIQISTNIIDWEESRLVTIPLGGSTNVVQTLTSGSKFYRAVRQ